MKKHYLFALLMFVTGYAYAQDNPYAIFGYKPKTILKDEPEHLKVFNKDTTSLYRAFEFDADSKNILLFGKDGRVLKTVKVETNETYRFMTVDPRSEKYYETNPYHYTLNNPIRYIDPNGDTVRVAGNQEQQQQLNNILANLRTTKAGEALYQQLNGSKNVFTINVSEGGESFTPTSPAYGSIKDDGSKNQGSGGVINIDPNVNTASGVATTMGYDVNPTTNLAHEMGHAVDANNGTTNTNTYKNTGLGIDEFSAVHSENKVRSQLPNTGLRTFYNENGVSVPVLRNGNSAIYFPGIHKTGYNYLHPKTKR